MHGGDRRSGYGAPHGAPHGPPHLQLVQPHDAGHASLPTSVPMSADGEEGASVYAQRLLESNMSAAATRCVSQQVPPNRTIQRGGGAPSPSGFSGGGGGGGGLTDEHRLSQSTSMLKQLSVTVDAAGLTPTRHPLAPPGGHLATREASGDYVSSSVLSGWRAHLGEGRPVPPLPLQQEGQGAAEQGERQQKQRSSSADSVCRRFIRLTKRLTTRTPKGPPLLVAADPASSGSRGTKPDEDCFDNAGGVKGKEVASGASSHWELPPNYVDMIFSKGAGGGSSGGGKEKQSGDLVEAEKQLSSRSSSSRSSPKL